jgi:gliding motility-associated-like protein
MKKIYSFLICLCLLCFSHIACATHIVGGEFELSRIQNNTYQLTLNLYFDLINGDADAEDRNIFVSIFRKADNVRMADITLPRVETEEVNYSNPTCSSARVRTKLIKYREFIILNAALFNDVDGYYVVWERCCRNRTITNIITPGDAGSTFYLTFPAVVRNGVPFINSSPTFTKPVGDYICVNEPFTFEFGATDPDGDELRYSLVTPYAGYSSSFPVTNRIPRATGSSNYPEVTWAQSINLNNVIPGPKPLKVDAKTGQLTVTTNRTGLYVFSVLCEEYRNNVRIGSVRRDFQLLAIDCIRNSQPGVRMREVGKPQFYASKDTLVIESDAQRCFDLLMTDPDPGTQLTVSLRPINFVNNNLVTLTPNSGIVNGKLDTLRTQLCWSNCAESTNNRPLVFELITRDQGCPSPKTDTLLVKILFKPKPNQKPFISTDLPSNTATATESSVIWFLVTGEDKDQDFITLEAMGRGFDLESVGMRFQNGGAVGDLSIPFVWNPICSAINKDTYVVDFIVKDSRCDKNQSDTVTVTLKYRWTDNDPPTIVTTLPGNKIEYYIADPSADSLSPIPLGDAIVFDVIAEDMNQDIISIQAAGRGFDMAEIGMQFQNKTGKGRVVSPFVWNPDCSALQGDDNAVYIVDFITDDQTCTPNRRDTVTVELNIRDLAPEYTFEPYNVFTPNDDDKNPTFRLPDLPEDNCKERFESIEIYNRWGRVVFKSFSRNFSWTGDNYPTGDYFYLIKYTKRNYKGHVSILY